MRGRRLETGVAGRYMAVEAEELARMTQPPLLRGVRG